MKDKSGLKGENAERQKDNTEDSGGFHLNFNELRWTNIYEQIWTIKDWLGQKDR